MYVDVECKGCQANYRVPAKLAGRMAQCKQCGQKFMVPYKNGKSQDANASSKLVQEDEPARKRPDLQHLRADEQLEAGVKREKAFIADVLANQALEQEEKDRRKRKFGEQEPTLQGVPPLVTDLWVPLLLLLVSYGIAIFVAISNLLDSPGRTAGFILMGVVATLYVVLVLPLTMKMIESAAGTLNFGLSNAAWLQTISLFGIPTAAMTVGFFGGGWVGLIAGLIIGLTIMMPCAMLLYRVNVLTAVQAVVLGSMFYLLAMAGDIAVMIGVAFFIVPMWKLTLPWQEAPAEVASTESTPAESNNTAQEVPAAVVDKTPEKDPDPIAAKKTEVVVVPKEVEPVWTPVIDGLPAAINWPDNLHHLLYCQPPVSVVHSATISPFVALFDKDSCDVYDLRNGNRTGGIKSTMRAAGALLSPDGSLLSIMRPPQAIDIWSVALGKHVGKIVPAEGAVLSTPLAFVKDNRLLTTGMLGGKQAYQVWDTATGEMVRSIEAMTTNSFAVSPGGRVLATLRPGKLTVIDLEAGTVVGEADIDLSFFTIKGMEISLDGTKLAAAVTESGPAQLLVIDLTTGKVLHAHPLAADKLSSVAKGSGKTLMWMPDSAGVVFDGQMYDVASGKPIAKVTAPPINGVEGKPVGSVTLFGVMYAYPPQSAGDRFVFKSAAAPRAEIVANLKAIRGKDWEPPVEVPVVAEVATVTKVDEIAAPKAPTFNVPELVRRGEWVVKITAIARADPDAVAEQIKVEQAKLPELQRTYERAKIEVERVSEYETYYVDGVRKRRRKYDDKVISEANVAKVRSDSALDKQKALVKRLERERDDAIKTRTVVGQLTDLENGPQVNMTVEGETLLTTIDSMSAGASCRVAGTGRYADGILTVTPRIIVPLP